MVLTSYRILRNNCHCITQRFLHQPKKFQSSVPTFFASLNNPPHCMETWSTCCYNFIEEVAKASHFHNTLHQPPEQRGRLETSKTYKIWLELHLRKRAQVVVIKEEGSRIGVIKSQQQLHNGWLTRPWCSYKCNALSWLCTQAYSQKYLHALQHYFNFFPHACNLKTPNKRHKTQRFKLQGDEKGMDQGGRRAWHTMEMGCQRIKVAEFSMYSSFGSTSRDEV